MARKLTAAPAAKSARKSANEQLKRYSAKRDFEITPEPSAKSAARRASAPRFVIQKHWARRLHYDFRLEIEGTMKSWAVPKGPSLDPAVKRMAVHVEDHPIAYNDFEGTIPQGQYGAGDVIIWDKGHWHTDTDAGTAYRAGKLKFELSGQKLQGRWTLVRMGHRRSASAEPGAKAEDDVAEREDGNHEAWLLIKERDGFARTQADYDVTNALPDSVTKRAKKATTQEAATIPATVAPQLATRVSAAPGSADWLFELKYDGYRIMTRIEAGKPRLYTRNGHDWTTRLPGLAQALKHQALPDGWYDGEIVMLDANGRPDFQALQNAFESEAAGARRLAPKKFGPTPQRDAAPGLVYFLFDLPWSGHEDLRKRPLTERRARLAAILQKVEDPTLRLSAAFDAAPSDMLRSACDLGLEGIIGKRRDSSYTSGRSGHWIKLKCGERQEFVIGGYTEPKGSRTGFGALLLGYYNDDGALQYAGNVGTGFSETSLKALHRQLKGLQQDRPPFAHPPRIKDVHWVKPELAAEVSFSQWTQSGRVRHAVFHGLRDDKPTRQMKKEFARTITNADRVVDASSGIRKADIASYYERIASHMLPHLKDRPISLLRAPDGIKGELFFQKHVDAAKLSGIVELDPALYPGHESLVVVKDAAGLAELAQMNAIELHTWNAVSTRIDRPDRISFDLDPGQGVKWPAMQEAALLLRNFLHELGLPAFVKTSGGKGLHIIVPILRRYDWDTVKGFSRAVVQHMTDVLPKRFAAKSGPRNRVGKIFIDYLRNGFGATTVSAWSLRARTGMGVSVPIAWEEVEGLKSGDQWTISNIDERADIGNKPWADYDASATALGPAMKRLGYSK